MKTIIQAELWNSFSPVQKRAIAENLLIENVAPAHDYEEIAAWTSTVTAALAAVAFASILLH